MGLGEKRAQGGVQEAGFQPAAPESPSVDRSR